MADPIQIHLTTDSSGRVVPNNPFTGKELPPAKSYQSVNTVGPGAGMDRKLDNVEYDEITYAHPLYSSVQNPTLGYVWIVLPSFGEEVTSADDLMKKLTSAEKIDYKTANKLYTLPQNLVSFNFERYLMGVGKFTIQLYDNNYTEIEDKILKNKGIIAFQYGYAANQSAASNWHFGFITSYSIQFQLEGTYISLTGVSTGWLMNVTQKAVTFKGKENSKGLTEYAAGFTNISEFVHSIAYDFGFTEPWQRMIEETLPIKARGSSIKNMDAEHIGLNAKSEDTTFDLVMKTLIPQSVNTDGQGGYCFYVEDTDRGPILHYHTLNYTEKFADGKRKLFTLFKSPNTVVRSFVPDWATSAIQARGGGKVGTIGYDPKFKVVLTSERAITDARTKMMGGTGATVTAQMNPTPGEVNDFIHNAGDTKAGLEAKLATVMDPLVLQAVRGTLEIQGCVSFQMCETVAVHVYIPKGAHQINKVTGSPQIHWISGDFKITKIVDSISNGDYKTTLDLVFGGRELLVERREVGKDAPNG